MTDWNGNGHCEEKEFFVDDWDLDVLAAKS